VTWHRPRYGAADVVVVAEGLDECHDLTFVVHRDRDAQVRQVPDAALGQVHVVVEEDIAGSDRLDGKVTHDRLDQR
jgi:hypothetical protein